MGADKWAQVRDPAWYGDDPRRRDAALAALPRVLVVPRPGFDVVRRGGPRHRSPSTPHVSSTRGPRRRASPGRARRARRRLIVDGNNVIGSRPDGWWRDRPARPAGWSPRCRSSRARPATEVAVVFDGRPLADLAEGAHDGVRVAYARRAGATRPTTASSRKSSTTTIPSSLTVVTSDRGLAERVRALGAAGGRRGRAYSRVWNRNARDAVVALGRGTCSAPSTRGGTARP